MDAKNVAVTVAGIRLEFEEVVRVVMNVNDKGMEFEASSKPAPTAPWMPQTFVEVEPCQRCLDAEYERGRQSAQADN